MKITPDKIREDIHKAYLDARKNKRNSLAQIDFEIGAEINLNDLIEELVERTYKPQPPFCFIVFEPVVREVYDSQFRDRVVQHMLFNSLAPLFEKLFIYDTYSCRIGKGTSFGRERFMHHLRSVTNNFTKEAYVMMFDLSGHFMKINKPMLIDEIMTEVYAHLESKAYDDKTWGDLIDPEFCEFLLHAILDGNPSENCIFLGDIRNKNMVPERKRMSGTPPDCGIVIGDITSQLLSNVHLNVTDQWAKRERKVKHWGHYVDDHFAMHNDLSYLQELEKDVIKVFWEKIHSNVHPKKTRYYKATDAMVFLGGYIRPYYTVPRQRTINKFTDVMQSIELELLTTNPAYEELMMARTRINSYCGILRQFKSYNIRKKYIDVPAFRKYFTIDEKIEKVTILPEYEKAFYMSDNRW